ncbi:MULTISPECIES: sigma factor-like helix-turn-helix DNA-binding protein [Rhodococcus]|nr:MULTISPECIES: sigma factor-like helix-turn-helix DNA-binding protein [Rhodococcus]NIL74895.1 RNA polymerase sigma factor RpoS [Rhodococcus sp. B10]
MSATRTVRPLRQWQAEALMQWQRNGRRGIIEAVRGAGKDEVGITAISSAVEQGSSALVLVRDADAVARWKRAIESAVPKARVHVVGAASDGHANVTVAKADSINHLFPGSRRVADLLIVDDAHMLRESVVASLVACQFRQTLGLARYGVGSISSSLARALGDAFVACDYPRAQRDGHLAPYRVLLVGVPFKAEEAKRYSKHDDAAKRARAELARRYRCRLNSEDNFELDVLRLADGPSSDAGTQTARRYLTSVSERRDSLDECIGKTFALREIAHRVQPAGHTLVFTESKGFASRCAEALLEEGLLAAPFSLDLEAGDRRELQTTFDRGVMSVLTMPSHLDAMTDIPDASTAVLVASSRSRRSMLHRMGRVVGSLGPTTPTQVVVLYMEDTVEDPKAGGRGTYLDELTSSATEVVTRDVLGAVAQLAEWLQAQPARRSVEAGVRDDRSLEELAFRMVDDGPSTESDRGDRGSEEIRELLRRAEATPTMDELDAVLRSLAVLEEREVEIVIARYGLDGDPPRTYPQIAARVGVTAGRVSQVDKNAIQKLRLGNRNFQQ